MIQLWQIRQSVDLLGVNQNVPARHPGFEQVTGYGLSLGVPYWSRLYGLPYEALSRAAYQRCLYGHSGRL